MPLTFLTVDRAVAGENDAADRQDDVLSLQDPGRRRRPYRVGPWRVAASAVLLLLSAFVLLSAMIILLAGSSVDALLCAALGVVSVTCAVRIVRMGTWVSAEGVRRTGFWRTRSVGWDAVGAIRTVQQPVRWLGLPRSVQGQAVLLHRSGEAEPVVLIAGHDADFLGRADAFARASDRLEAWAEQYAAR